MPDIFLRAGDATPQNVILRDPTQPDVSGTFNLTVTLVQKAQAFSTSINEVFELTMAVAQKLQAFSTSINEVFELVAALVEAKQGFSTSINEVFELTAALAQKAQAFSAQMLAGSVAIVVPPVVVPIQVQAPEVQQIVRPLPGAVISEPPLVAPPVIPSRGVPSLSMEIPWWEKKAEEREEEKVEEREEEIVFLSLPNIMEVQLKPHRHGFSTHVHHILPTSEIRIGIIQPKGMFVGNVGSRQNFRIKLKMKRGRFRAQINNFEIEPEEIEEDKEEEYVRDRERDDEEAIIFMASRMKW